MVKNLESGKKTLDEYEINFIELRKGFDTVDITECVGLPEADEPASFSQVGEKNLRK